MHAVSILLNAVVILYVMAMILALLIKALNEN